MIDLLQTLLVVGGITFWLSRGERLVRDIIAARVNAREREIEQQAKVEAIPADLLAQANSYADDWARQGALDHMYELYGKFKDWSKVRASLAVNAGTV